MSPLIARSPGSFLAAALCLFPTVVVPAHAQEDGQEGDVTLDDFEQSVAELSRDFEARQIEFEKIGAYIGGREPWPRPDPELPFAVWKDAVPGAERLTAGEILDRSETVKLSVARNQFAADLFDGPRDMIGASVEAVVAAGRHTDPDSEVKLVLQLLLGSSTIEFSRSGQSTGSESVHYLQTNVELVLPARVLRAGAVHHVPLGFAKLSTMTQWPSQPGRAELQAAMTEAARRMFDGIGGIENRVAEGPGVWGAWIGDLAQSNLRFDEWNAAFRKDSRKLTPALEAVPGFGEIAPWDDTYLSDWRRALGASGFSAGLVDAPDLRGELFFQEYDGGKRLNGGGLLMARTSVVERDAVAVLGGRYVRVVGSSFVHITLPRFTSPSNRGERIAEVQRIGIQKFMAELGQAGARAGQVRHADADLVANYLRTRERVPLPAELVDDVSNKIAMALAGAPDIPAERIQEWKTSRGGVSMLYLPWVGSARSAELVPRDVQQAVRRVIDDLTLADPLGIYAFDQPFHFDGSRGYQDELPEGFVELLAERPSGAGALERVYVDTADSAAWDLASSYGQKDRYKTVQGSLRSTFEGHRILVCQYIPGDGDVSYSTTRYFWYGAEPEGWAEVLATLPPEIKLDRIGPALGLPPKYVDEADALIAR